MTLAAGLVALVAWLVLDSLWRAGELSSLTPQPLACRAVPGLVGPEDITVDARRQVAYISATDARAFTRGFRAAGGLYRYAPGAAAPELLYARQDDTFHPHGIGLFSDGQEPDLLYVVNHPTQTSHTIEVFEVHDAGLRHVRTIRDPRLVSPNDVVAVGRDELYVTNDHGIADKSAQLRDDLLRRERGQIVHLKDGTARTLVSDLAYANGINATPDGSELYVAECTGRRLRVYARAPDGALTETRRVDLGTAPDNIELAADGSLYIGAHPKLFTFLRHLADPSVPSPSEAVRVADGEVERVYLDLGTELSASSVAAPFGDRLLIGSVFADHILDCALR